MRLVTLNLWGGRMKETFGDFFASHKDVDIWCLQEVYRGSYTPHEKDIIDRSKVDFFLHTALQTHLPDHNTEFVPVLKNVYGITMFIRKNIRIIERGEVLVARGDYEDVSDIKNRDHHRKLLWVEAEIAGKKVLIVNIHLTHRPEGKSDSDKRLVQSRTIIDFLDKFDCPKIVAGDFNLLPETESIRLIENAGIKNLVKEFNVSSTRTPLYLKPLKFADYVFVSPEIKVNDFRVLPDIVSDHAPLMLDFDIE